MTTTCPTTIKTVTGANIPADMTLTIWGRDPEPETVCVTHSVDGASCNSWAASSRQLGECELCVDESGWYLTPADGRMARLTNYDPTRPLLVGGVLVGDFIAAVAITGPEPRRTSPCKGGKCRTSGQSVGGNGGFSAIRRMLGR